MDIRHFARFGAACGISAVVLTLLVFFPSAFMVLVMGACIAAFLWLIWVITS